MYNKKELGTFLRERRELKGFSLEELAELCDVSGKCINNIELGKSEPRLGTALKICFMCEIGIGEILDFAGRGGVIR